MINEKYREVCVLYLTATCNLNCRYCFIDKSSALQEIDDILIESYKNNYFYNFMKEVFPNQDQLKRIEFWGGEPSYGLPRVKETIISAIKYYPNLNSFMMSTNFTTKNWFNDFYDFLDIFKQFPNRNFIFNLQLSLDGPTYINDLNRGKNTTQLFTKNFSKLVATIDDKLKEIPNLTLSMWTKPTLDNTSIAMLQDEQSIKDYINFSENFLDVFNKNVQNKRQCSFRLGIPNTASPSPHTQEDGKRFANLTSILLKLLKENKEKNHFPRQINYMLYSNVTQRNPNLKKGELNTALNYGCGTCGTGCRILGLLPNKLISSCHNGFVDLVTEYKTQAEKRKDQVSDHRTIDFHMFLNEGISNQSSYTLEEYSNYEKQTNVYTPQSTWQVKHLTSLIQMYAESGKIDNKYKNIDEAINAAHFIFDRTASCVRDNLGVTGSRYMTQVGYIPLFLNGAKENIEASNEYFSR